MRCNHEKHQYPPPTMHRRIGGHDRPVHPPVALEDVVGEETAGPQLGDAQRERSHARCEHALPVPVPAVARGRAHLVGLGAHDLVHDRLGQGAQELLHVHEAVLEPGDGQRRLRRPHVCNAFQCGHCLSLEPDLS